MVKDGGAIQIKSRKLEHECVRNHNNSHVNANWLAITYLEQLRANPSWTIVGIIQAMMTN